MVNGLLDREGVDAVLNDLDEYAVEEALRIVEAHGEGHTVTIISMGPERTSEAVRKALSMGADDAIVITDAGLVGADSLMTSKVLASAITSGGFDLVLCGTESTDARMSVVPAMLAQRLGWAQLTFAGSVVVDPASSEVTITRVTEDGVDTMKAKFPAVISVIEKINEPRYPSFKGIMDIRALATVGIPAESSWSAVSDASPRPPRSAGVKIVDEGKGGEALVNYLAEKKLI